MLSISEDSASARNPTCPRLTPSSGISLATTHSAARRIVPSPPKTTISSIPSSSLTGLEAASLRAPAADHQFGQIIGRQRGHDPGRAQSLDESIRCGDCGWSAHVREHGDAAYRICTCTTVLAISLGCSLGHLPQHIEYLLARWI